MKNALLTLDGVHTHIQHYHILQGVSFAIPKARITLLLGRNGAGKTTCLRTVMGLWKPSSGTITLDGMLISGKSTPEIARSGIAYVPENMGIFHNLSVQENLRLAARQGKLEGARLDWILDLFPPLEKFWNLPAGNLSGGQKQMLSIARAILEPFQLLLVDEPSKGLAPSIIETLIQAFGKLKQDGATILMVEQNLMMAQALGDEVHIMDDGQIVFSSEMDTFAADKNLQETYLGLSFKGATI